MKLWKLPWQERHTVVCPKCGGTIEMLPLVPGEEIKDLALLEHTICHKIDADLLAVLPRLSEADCTSRQKWLCYLEELHKPTGENKTYEEIQELFVWENGLAAYFNRHGIFVLRDYLSKASLDALLLMFANEENVIVETEWLMTAMGVSKAHAISKASVSNIIKSLKKFGLLVYAPWSSAKGRARSRKRGHTINPSARIILNRDLQNHAFFRSYLMDVVGSVAEKYPNCYWRKDLFGTSN